MSLSVLSVNIMTIYIIRPKNNAVASSLDLISRKLDPIARNDQVAEVIELQEQDPVQQDIRDWFQDVSPDSRIQVKHPKFLGVTGTTVVDMADELADQLRTDLPEIYVLKDQPLELIRPVKLNAFKREGELNTSDLWHLEAISYPLGRERGLTGSGRGIGIAVLDTGIDASHIALQGKVSTAYEFDTTNWRAIRQTNSLDTDGHGTHVAGLIAGNRVGVAPEANLLSGVVLPKRLGKISTFILALEWVATQPEIQIVNISGGFQGYRGDMNDAIAGLLATGVLPVCAIGNDGRNITCSPGNYREVVSVGASNKNNQVSSFSSSGRLTCENHIYQVPDLVAPGEAVYSSVVTGGYQAWNGTSMATPIVSGVAALILEKYPDMTITQLRYELLSRCKLLEQPAERQGNGLIQVELSDGSQ